jgi:polysaccharide export outer membrane protein
VRWPLFTPTRFGLAVGFALLSGCAGTGQYVWVDDLPPDPQGSLNDDYLVQPGDVLSIHVVNQEALTTRNKVRADGRISIPFLGEIEARGKRPSALRGELEARLKDYLVSPSVTVAVEESQPMLVSVVGEVARSGVFPLDPRSGIAQALATAGGLTDYASRTSIYVVRSSPTPMRVRFTYGAILRGEGRATSFALHSGDVIVAE